MNSPLPPNAVVLTPTQDFFMAGTVMVRQWTGETRDGVKVVALIAAIALAGDTVLPGLIPIPPPEPDWHPRVRDAIDRIWKIAAKLLPDEAEGLATTMERLTGGTVEEMSRRAAAQSFLLYTKFFE